MKKKYCVFPDQSKFEIVSLIETNEVQTHLVYKDGNDTQELWVPNDYVHQV